MRISRVYVETTIPSFYCDRRVDPAIVARREWTRRWWEIAISRDELVTSVAVMDELAAGDSPQREERLQLLQSMDFLSITPAIGEIVTTYIAHRLMPADPGGDALHLALASYHRCDFLVTWNCRHLANARKFAHIRRVNTMLGLSIPVLVTPLELLDDEGEA